MPVSALFYIVIFIEGYAVLAAELIAIRNLVSYVGNGTDIVSIVIAATLLPLAAGYYRGGAPFASRISVRKRLIRNFTVALAFLALGLSALGMDAFFLMMSESGLHNRLLLTLLYSAIFLAPPIFLLGQTIPLITRMFRHGLTSAAAGRVLFWSTIGSCLGSVFSTVIVMAFFGVHVAALLVVILMAVAIALLNRTVTLRTLAVPAAIVLLCLVLNSGYVFKSLGIYYQNAHNTVRISESEDGMKLLLLNNGPSSMYKPSTGERMDYIEAAEKILLDPIKGQEPRRDILTIGAGGFTFGLKDEFHTYTYVDIDPDLKKLAEDYFLGQKLTPNKRFVAQAARAFLADAIAKKKTFDLVYIDTFNGDNWIPEDLVTRDFFEQISKVLKPDGIVSANFIVSPNFTNAYSLHLDQTFRSVFPATMRLPIQELNAWERDPLYMMNVLYIGYNSSKSETIYTDNRNQIFWDK